MKVRYRIEYFDWPRNELVAFWNCALFHGLLHFLFNLEILNAFFYSSLIQFTVIVNVIPYSHQFNE